MRQAVTLCTDGTLPARSPLVASHCYTVTWVDVDAAGNVTNIWLRNPWAGANAYLSLNPAQLAANGMWVCFGDTI